MTTQDVKPLPDRLSALADKMNAMYGRNPDADLVREAKGRLVELEEKTKTKRGRPAKGDNADD